MKFLITFIIAIAIVVLFPHKSEYRVKATYSLVEQEKSRVKVNLAVMPVDKLFETATNALSEIPQDAEWAVISKFKHAAIISQIYAGESNFGRHDVCRSRGGWNGWGFGEPNPLEHGPTCYESLEKVVSLVDVWIEQRYQEGFSLAEMNCYYIKGVRTSNCDTSYKLY